MTPPVVLTVDGSDPAGGTGVQGDLKTFAAMRVYGVSVLTAVGTRNTRGIIDVFPLPGNVVAGQLAAVLEDIPVAAVKTGMFASAEAVVAVTAKARLGSLPNLVVDPVLAPGTGPRRGVVAALERLLPHALLATPNRDEASALVGWQVATPTDMAGAASQLASNGPKYVVVTGGDLVSGDEAIDALWLEGSVRFLRAPRVVGRGTYGSGSAFASAAAARIALGDSVADAVAYAKSYVAQAISDATKWRVGAGNGPLDHFGWSSPKTAR